MQKVIFKLALVAAIVIVAIIGWAIFQKDNEEASFAANLKQKIKALTATFRESNAEKVDQLYPAPYGGKTGKITLRNLDLSRAPGEQELRRAGQLGSPLTPMGPAEPKLIKDREQRKRQEQDNLLFARAMDLWNRHKYSEAVQLFKQHRAQFPESPWAGESELHLGCEAQFNGRWDEAEFNFEWILNHANKGSDMYQKAKLRRSVLALEQGQIQLAIEGFKEMLETEKDWERRTYAQNWIRQLSLWKGFQSALRTCGSESVAYVCEIQGQTQKAEALRKQPAKGDHGFTLEELLEVAKEAGFDALAVRAGSGEFDKMATPFIAHYRDLHYVVVRDISAKSQELKIYDPRLKHEVLMSRETFLRQWSGLGVIFSEQPPKGVQLASAWDLKQVGGCCGIPKPEDDLGNKCKKSCKGLPVWDVNPVNFNLTIQDIPLWCENTIGPDVEILLTYNSQDAINQLRPFGNKWTFNYASYAMEGPGGKVTIVMSDGRRDEYAPKGGNAYNSPVDQPGNQLTKVGEYAYELELPDEMVYEYAVPEALQGESTTSLLVGIRDKYNKKLTLVHGKSGELIAIHDALNRVTQIFYNPEGYISQIVDSFGRQATFQYDPNHNLISQSDMGGISYSYSYGADSYLESITLPAGKTSFKIEPADGNSQVIGQTAYPDSDSPMWENYRITITDPLGHKEEYYYNGYSAHGWYRNKKQCLSNEPALQAPKTKYYYTVVSGKGNLSKIEYADGSQELFSDYTTQRQYQTHQDRNGNVQKFTYNDKGQLLTSTDAKNNVTTYVYAENGEDLLKVINALNQTVTENSYTPEGEIASSKNAGGQVTGYGYNQFGNVTAITNAIGEVTSYIYNNLQQVTEIQQAGNTLKTMTYDPMGRVKTTTDILGNTQTFEYDDLNRITKIFFSDGTFIENQWGCCRLERQTDKAGNMTFYFYDAVGNLIAQKDAENRVTQFTYDPNRNLVQLIDANGSQTRWEYDAMDRMVKKIYADGSELNYQHDKMGNLIKFTNARGQAINYGYDKNYNLTNINGVNLPSASFSYDALNRQTQMMDGIGTTTYGYDNANRLKTIDGPWNNDTITYDYDALNRITNRAIDSVSQTVSYDKMGRITSEKNALGTFTYDYLKASGLLNQITYPNQQKTTFDYHTKQEYRLREIHNQDPLAKNLSKFTYTYDQKGDIVQWEQQLGNNDPKLYHLGYDKVSQLKSAILKDQKENILKKSFYNYDPAGNRITEQKEDNPVKGIYNNLNQLTGTEAGGVMLFQGEVDEPASVKVNGQPAKMLAGNQFESYVSTAPGTNLITITAQDVQNNIQTNIYEFVVIDEENQILTYDLDGNLIKVSSQESTTSYEWDALSRLTRVTSQQLLVTNITEFVYDGLSRRVKILDKENGIIKSDKNFLWNKSKICEERNTNNQVVKRFLGSGIQIIEYPSQTISNYFYSRDHLGSIREMTDKDGKINAQYDYDAWGNRIKIAGNLESDFGFTGHYFHQPSGLYLTLYRGYNPNTGLWLSRDPLQEDGGRNLYTYVLNNPINFIDPHGLKKAPPGAQSAISKFAEWGLEEILRNMNTESVVNSYGPERCSDGKVRTEVRIKITISQRIGKGYILGILEKSWELPLGNIIDVYYECLCPGQIPPWSGQLDSTSDGPITYEERGSLTGYKVEVFERKIIKMKWRTGYDPQL